MLDYLYKLYLESLEDVYYATIAAYDDNRISNRCMDSIEKALDTIWYSSVPFHSPHPQTTVELAEDRAFALYCDESAPKTTLGPDYEVH